MDDPGGHLIRDQLTARELEILHLVAEGRSNQDIADRLVITLDTTKWHIKNIFSKLAVSNRTQAVVVARANRLFDSTLAASPPRPNLPSQPTTFVGRLAELTAIGARLDDPACRLLTLVGPGGIGKTRLALQTAEDRAKHLPDGVCFVSLVSINSASLISTILSALNVPSYRQDDPQVDLFKYLRNKAMLLILDNFEHLLDDAELLSEILAHASEVKLLATSRERLGLQEEWLFQVHGMDVPGDDEVTEIESYGAIRLFLQQARRLQPGFSLAAEADRRAVVRICQIAEGMPLGLELAASWLRAIPPQQIARRITQSLDFMVASTRNMPKRHRSIRSVFEQSWNLLSPAERSVLMKLSIFRGGFTLQAAEQVAGASIALIAALIDKSQVRPEQANRYDMHELLRQFAYEKLHESNEMEEVRRLHLDFFLKLAEEAKSRLEKSDQAKWLQRLAHEHNNFRETFRWVLESGAIEPGLRLGSALWLFWLMRGHMVEGRKYFADILTLAQTDSPTIAYAEALDKAGVLAPYQGDYEQARSYVSEALSIYREFGDKHGIANTLANLGYIAFHQDDFTNARTLYAESLEINQELDNQQGLADSLSHLAQMAYFDSDYAEARRLNEKSLIIWRALGDQQGIAWALHCLGNVILSEDGPASAYPLFAQAFTISKELNYRWGFACTLEDFARLAGAKGEFERVLRLAGAAAALRKAISFPLPPPEHTALDNLLALARQKLDAQTASVEWINGQSMSAEQALTELGAEAYAGAWERGAPLDLDTTVRELLAEFRSDDEAQAAAMPAPPHIRAVNQALLDPLTPRELEVLSLICSGLSNQQIADHLVVGVSTIKKHINGLYRKLAVTSRSQAILRAQELGLA
jgi:predicted ATPase/DNA-binding NarL/FixJ family response regulator